MRGRRKAHGQRRLRQEIAVDDKPSEPPRPEENIIGCLVRDSEEPHRCDTRREQHSSNDKDDSGKHGRVDQRQRQQRPFMRRRRQGHHAVGGSGEHGDRYELEQAACQGEDQGQPDAVGRLRFDRPPRSREKPVGEAARNCAGGEDRAQFEDEPEPRGSPILAGQALL